MNINDINRIVFYGCSFTEGKELSDVELFPGKTQEELDVIKRKIGNRFYETVDLGLMTKLNTESSWARWTADHIGKPWANRSRSGSSMGEIIFKIEQDLLNGYLTSTDLIIVGITSPERICTFRDTGQETLIVSDTGRWKSSAFLDDFITTIANDNYILYNWVKDIKYLDMLSDRLNGRLLQQWVWGGISELLTWNNGGKMLYNPFTYVKSLIEWQNNFKSMITPDLSFTRIGGWEDANRHVLYHPKIEKHKEFAAIVADDLVKRFS